MSGITVSPAEVARFDALAGRWWDPDGPMRPLHRMNPVRVAWIVERISSGRLGSAPAPAPVAGGSLGEAEQGRPRRRILDIGCGAGLAAEALARQGFDVLGLDAAAEAIEAARAHATGQELPLSYRVGVAENLVAERARFPVVTALEVIEHVPDPAAFVRALVGLLEPGGQLFVSTLNRTPRAFLAAKLGAEYLLRWLPIGTHDWRRFITPVELGAMLRHAGLRVTDTAGLALDPLTGRWRVVRDTAVNYIVAAAV